MKRIYQQTLIFVNTNEDKVYKIKSSFSTFEKALQDTENFINGKDPLSDIRYVAMARIVNKETDELLYFYKA